MLFYFDERIEGIWKALPVLSLDIAKIVYRMVEGHELRLLASTLGKSLSNMFITLQLIAMIFKKPEEVIVWKLIVLE